MSGPVIIHDNQDDKSKKETKFKGGVLYDAFRQNCATFVQDMFNEAATDPVFSCVFGIHAPFLCEPNKIHFPPPPPVVRQVLEHGFKIERKPQPNQARLSLFELLMQKRDPDEVLPYTGKILPMLGNDTASFAKEARNPLNWKNWNPLARTTPIHNYYDEWSRYVFSVLKLSKIMKESCTVNSLNDILYRPGTYLAIMAAPMHAFAVFIDVNTSKVQTLGITELPNMHTVVGCPDTGVYAALKTEPPPRLIAIYKLKDEPWIPDRVRKRVLKKFLDDKRDGGEEAVPFNSSDKGAQAKSAGGFTANVAQGKTIAHTSGGSSGGKGSTAAMGLASGSGGLAVGSGLRLALAAGEDPRGITYGQELNKQPENTRSGFSGVPGYLMGFKKRILEAARRTDPQQFKDAQATEDIRDNEERGKAATSIQANIRGKRARQTATAIRARQAEIQEKEEKRAQDETRGKAATAIQANIRGKWARQAEIQEKEEKRAQDETRGKAATSIQANIRGKRARQTATAIRARQAEIQEKEEKRAQDETRGKAATAIQANIRGKRARQTAVIQKKDEAAVRRVSADCKNLYKECAPIYEADCLRATRNAARNAARGKGWTRQKAFDQDTKFMDCEREFFDSRRDGPLDAPSPALRAVPKPRLHPISSKCKVLYKQCAPSYAEDCVRAVRAAERKRGTSRKKIHKDIDLMDCQQEIINSRLEGSPLDKEEARLREEEAKKADKLAAQRAL